MSGLSREEEICLRELDHLQAIVARYDGFFFWGKNLCLVAIGAGIWLTAEGHFSLLLLVALPIFFFFAEVFFRWRYWTPKIARINEIRKYLNTKPADFSLYQLKAKREECPFKCYDIAFYVAIFFGLLILIIVNCYCNVLHPPWK